MCRLASLLAVVLLTAHVSCYPSAYLQRSGTIPVENVRRVDRVTVPHRVRQVVPDDESSDDFSVLHHLSGDSPYFSSPGVGLTAAVPTGCNVTRATYLIRHSDIYANDWEYENTLSPFIEKLGNFTDRDVFTRDSALAFLANWTSPYTDPDEQIEKVTDLGKADAAALGALIAQRHESILSVNGSGQFKVWTADASRDQDTARAFVEGFNTTFSDVSLIVVEEGEEQAANTLTPHESCEDYDSDAGSTEQDRFIAIYTPPIASRLNQLTPSFNWTNDDVYAAQSLCGYDTVIRNQTSGFCKIFGEDEWLAFEYANDLMYHRSLGYGNEFAPVLGMPWISASARLLSGTANTTQTNANSSADTQNLWISFTHREEPPFIVTALGLFNTSNASMPTNRINYERAWKTSEILPFLANVALERMECDATAVGHNTSGTYIRTLVNSATIPLPDCASGPDGSCPLADFQSFIAARESLYGDFSTACGLNSTNATNTLGIYEGFLPDGGAAVQVTTILLNGTDGNGVGAKKKGGSGSNSTSTSEALTTTSSQRKTVTIVAALVAIAALAL